MTRPKGKGKSREMDSSQQFSHSMSSANQYQGLSTLEKLPNLKDILQKYVDEGVKQIDIPEKFQQDHNLSVRLRTVQKYMKNLGVVTTRRNGLTKDQKEEAIDSILLDDPLGRWGSRLVKEKLSRHSIHIPRNRITEYRAEQDPEGSASRHPMTRKVHHHGLWSIGPNEEWCVDGHEKVLLLMGIAIWGILDKCTRMELALWATPNARVKELPPALYLRLVKLKGGMSLSTTSDKGSEVGLLISLVTTLRKNFQPFLNEEQLPAFKAVKSVFNVTRERGWRPIWEKELGNIAHEYKLGKASAGFIENDEFHIALSQWLWGAIVQLKLDEIVQESRTHRIRKQKGTLLPSGARRIDMYEHPERYGLEDQLLKIPEDVDIDQLLAEYDRPDLLQFGTDEQVKLFEEIYECIGKPTMRARDGWAIFSQMVNYYYDCFQTEQDGVGEIYSV